MRYQGQGACLQVPLTRRVANTFVKEHQRRFGFSTDSPIEIVQISARSECPAKSLPAASLAVSRSSAKPCNTRRPPLGGPLLPIYDRRDLTKHPIVGPAVIEEATATTLLPAKCKLHPSEFGLQITPR